MTRIDILTLFPDMFTGPFGESIIKRAVNNGSVSIHLHQLRDYATDKHKTVDDTPYGGGAGMVLRVDVIDHAINSIIKANNITPYKILLTPQGQVFNQATARQLSSQLSILLICGRYEGFDERVRGLVDAEISIGDYVLSGGELPAMVVVDAIVRLLPGAIGNDASHRDESHEKGLLEYPQYTRPEEHNGQAVPPVLLSGNHADINSWRAEQARVKTQSQRPDLIS